MRLIYFHKSKGIYKRGCIICSSSAQFSFHYWLWEQEPSLSPKSACQCQHYACLNSLQYLATAGMLSYGWIFYLAITSFFVFKQSQHLLRFQWAFSPHSQMHPPLTQVRNPPRNQTVTLVRVVAQVPNCWQTSIQKCSHAQNYSKCLKIHIKCILQK